MNSETIPNPLRDLRFDYCEAYLDSSKTAYELPIALIPPRTSDRIFAQKGYFTLQGSNLTPLNKIPELISSVVKFEIPLNCIDEANKFLKLVGVNDYSIFPDLDGLAKHLNKENGL